MLNIFRRGSKKKTNKQQQQQQLNEKNNDHQNSKFEKVDCGGGAFASSLNETTGVRSTTADNQQSHNPQQPENFHRKDQLLEFSAATIDNVSSPIDSIKSANHQNQNQQADFSEFGTNDSYASSSLSSSTSPSSSPSSKLNKLNFRYLFNDLIMAKGRHHRNRHQNNSYFGHSQKKNQHNNNGKGVDSSSKHGYQITDSKNSEMKNLEEKKVANEESARALPQKVCMKFENEPARSTPSSTTKVEQQQSKANSCEVAECSEKENCEKLSNLTEYDCDIVMGQSNAKSVLTPPIQAAVPPSRPCSPNIKQFRESSIGGDDGKNVTVTENSSKTVETVVIPTITVEDFSKEEKIKSEKEEDFLSCNDNEEEVSEDEEVEEEEEEVDEEDDEDEAADHITPLIKSENSSDSNLSSPDSGYVSSMQNNSHRQQFIRDGNSTDCDEHLIHDDYTSGVNGGGGGGEILIESISLPDVVVDVEASHSNNHLSCCDNYLISSASDKSEEKNVHFIPIKVEKRGSLDDSVFNENVNGLYKLNSNHRRNSNGVTITAEEDEINISHQKCMEEKKRELVNQEIKFTAQLDEAQKQIESHRSRIIVFENKILDLERDLTTKSWNVDRLQAELEAAHKENESVRKRLKILEDEKEKIRQKHFEDEESYSKKYDDLDRQYKELEEKYKNLTILCCSLHSELAGAQVQEAECRKKADSLRIEKEQEVKTLQNALSRSEEEKKMLEMKWQKEFELLRTQNADREEHLITDCEWQLRVMQKQCKEKIDVVENAKSEALEKAAKIESEAREKLSEVCHLKTYEAEVKQLRGLTCEQASSLQAMTEQIEELKSDLEAANKELESQIECVKKIKHQCDVALSDQQRQMLQKIDEVRNDAAEQWETKLITEMTRLKVELESVYVDDRRDELDRLQAEHIEEIKALTNRYTANEEELRQELEELQQQFMDKQSDFEELREKSDNAILQTRMHLDRADRDYQHAMCREEEKKEHLIETLREEFTKEKLEMEEKFRERLGHVKEEFSTELATQSQELSEEHKKELDEQYFKLMAEKEEAIQNMEKKHRKKYDELESKMRNIEIQHQRDIKDLKNSYDIEKTLADKRDINNSQEIEQLHRKCRCLTNLFEEMRMRYERRDPRTEDLKEISELRNRCESQERDLCVLTERLRDMQMQIGNLTLQKNGKIRKPPTKIIPTSCDVIYEENEDRESVNGNDEDDDDDDEEDSSDGVEEVSEITSNGNGGKLIKTSC